MGFGRKKGYIKKFFIALLILVILMSSAVFGYVSYQNVIQSMKDQYESEIETLKVEKYMKKRVVYWPRHSLEKGELLTEDLVELKEIYSNFSETIFMNEEDFGKRITIDYTVDMPILRNTLISEEVNDDHRLREISTVLLQSDLKTNEYIDCRIRYANGLEFIVLSKKQIKKIDLSNNTIWLSLNEKESLLLSSALVDKAYFKGSSFYINRYIESNIQRKARVNYIPNIQVIELIADEFSIESWYSTVDIEKRNTLEKILLILDEEQRSQVEESVNNEEAYVNKRVANQEISEIKKTEGDVIQKKEDNDGFN